MIRTRPNSLWTRLNNIIWLPIGWFSRQPVYQELGLDPSDSLQDIKVAARWGFSKKRLVEARIKRARDRNNKKITNGLRR